MNWFDEALDLTILVEGGFQKDPNDKGNWTGGEVGVGELKGTKWGISAASYPQLDIENLSLDTAGVIYRRDYWNPLGCDDIHDYRTKLWHMDFGVNSGVGRANRFLRDHPMFLNYVAERLRFLARLESFTRYGRGWTNRVATVLERIGSFAPETDTLEADVLVANHLTLGDRFGILFGGPPVLRGPWRARRRPRTGGDGMKLDVARLKQG